MNRKDADTISRGSVKKKYDGTESYLFHQFHRISVINGWMEKQAQRHAGVVENIVAGVSYEGRPIQGLCLFRGADKPRVFIEAGIHAQEWITTSTAAWFIFELLDGTDAEVQNTARQYEWHIFPNVNPDGYEYSFKTNRSWRKTRSKGVFCYGVDGNRNWDCGWKPGDQVSRNPCARNYPGRAPFCEPETRALSEYVRSLQPALKCYISLHSSKQMIMFPWGYTKELSTDHNELMMIAGKAADALERVHGTKFTFGPIASTIYVAPGNSVDWAYSIGIKYAFALELRNPTKPDRYVPASAIIDTGEETLRAVITILSEVKRDEPKPASKKSVKQRHHKGVSTEPKVQK